MKSEMKQEEVEFENNAMSVSEDEVPNDTAEDKDELYFYSLVTFRVLYPSSCLSAIYTSPVSADSSLSRDCR